METSTDGAAGPSAVAAVPPESLSPSRASDFMQCPLLYRFRARLFDTYKQLFDARYAAWPVGGGGIFTPSSE